VSTAGEYSYVGRLVVEFDSEGKVILDSINEEVSGAYATDEAGLNRVFGDDIDEAFAEGSTGEQVEALTDAVEEVVEETDGIVFGRTDVFLEGRRSEVRTQETNFGNLTADANLAAAKKADEDVVISIKNGGGIRAEIGSIDGTTGEKLPPEDGEISQLDLENSLRFNNGLTLLTVTAQELLDIIEHGVAESGEGATPGRFPQVSGLEFSFDDESEVGDRVESLAVVNEDGEVTDVIAEDGELQGDASRTFRIVTLNFLAGGGDGYPFPTGDSANRVDLVVDNAPLTGAATAAPDGSEQDALAEYLAENFSETPFDIEDVSEEFDTRIQNLEFREDTVLNGVEIGGDEDDNIGSDDEPNDNEFIDAGEGNNRVIAGAGNNTITAGTGNDEIDAGEGDNTINAGDGNNTVTAGAGNDTITTGTGSDKINPGAGNNIVNAGGGNDSIVGGQGDNQIDGGDGIDTVEYSGNSGDFEIQRIGDVIQVGSNTDTLTNVEILSFSDGNINTTDISEVKPGEFITEVVTAELADGNTVEGIDLKTGFTTSDKVKVDYTISREAAFNNEVYFYKVDDITGTVNGVAVGNTSEYKDAIKANIVAGTSFSIENNKTAVGEVEIDAGSLIIPLLVVNGTLEQALEGEGDATAYFAYSGANSDNGFDHIKLFNNTFAFEDLPDGGDEDFNDIKITIDGINLA
ncbi:MAG: 5'-nucleotidase C-terminal domain-containing protein, partial [Cyanobacteria bacterium J06621_15]